MIKYYPYKSDKPNKKYYIITNDNKKVYFGQATTRVVEHFINFFRANSTWKINFPQKKLRNIGGP